MISTLYHFGNTNSGFSKLFIDSIITALQNTPLRLELKYFQNNHNSDRIEFQKNIFEAPPQILILSSTDFTKSSIYSFFSLVSKNLKEKRTKIILILDSEDNWNFFDSKEAVLLFPDNKKKMLCDFYSMNEEKKDTGIFKGIFNNKKNTENLDRDLSFIAGIYQIEWGKLFFHHIIPNYDNKTDKEIFLEIGKKKCLESLFQNHYPVLPSFQNAVDNEIFKYSITPDFSFKNLNILSDQFLKNIFSGTVYSFPLSSFIQELANPEMYFSELNPNFKLKYISANEILQLPISKKYIGDADKALDLERKILQISSKIQSLEKRTNLLKFEKELEKDDETSGKITYENYLFFENLFRKSSVNSDDIFKHSECLILSYKKEIYEEFLLGKHNCTFYWIDLNDYSENEGLSEIIDPSYKSFAEKGFVFIDRESNVKFRYKLNKIKRNLSGEVNSSVFKKADDNIESLMEDYKKYAVDLFYENFLAYLNRVSQNFSEIIKKNIVSRFHSQFIQKNVFVLCESKFIESLVFEISHKNKYFPSSISGSNKNELIFEDNMINSVKYFIKKIHSKENSLIILQGDSQYLEFWLRVLNKYLNGLMLPVFLISDNLNVYSEKFEQSLLYLIYKNSCVLADKEFLEKQLQSSFDHLESYG